METIINKAGIHTQISNGDNKTLSRIVDLLGPIANLESIGRYSSMSADEVWLNLVVQVCVMGSARHMERLANDKIRYKDFEKAVSLSELKSQQSPTSYLSKALKEFTATRFYQKSAEKLVTLLNTPNILQYDKVLLLEGLSHNEDTIQTRDELIKRCRPIFSLKSASDFMITIGLSHDVIALDTRVVGIFQKYFDYNLNSGQVQSNRKIYLSLEAALREFCQKKQMTLALLDRLLFNFSNLSVIELVVKYPHLFEQKTK